MNNSQRVSSDAWQKRYREGRIGWDRGTPSPSLLNWLESGELQPCRVAIPGCGYGHEVVELAERGFEVTGIDFASLPVTALRRRLKEHRLVATIRQEDVFAFHFPEPVDAIFEQTCLCAIAPTRRAEFVTQMAKWLRPGGRLFACFMQTHRDGGPPFHCDMQEMRRLLGEPHWLWPDRHPDRIEHPSGLYESAVVVTRRGVEDAT